MKDLMHNVEHVPVLTPTSIATDTTTDADNYISLEDAESLTFFINAAVTDGEIEPLVQWAEEDENGDPDTWEAVPDDYLLGTEADATLDADGIAKIGYRGHKTGKKFLRCSVVTSGATVDVVVGVTGVKGELRWNPHSDQVVAA